MVEADRIDANIVSVEEFLSKYWAHGTPVVIENGVNNWPALTEWNLDKLRQKYGHLQVSCRQTHHAAYKLGSRYTTETMSFDRYVEFLYNPKSVTRKSGERRSYYLAVQNVKEVFPELLNDFSKPEHCGNTHRGPFLWIAPTGHFEYTHFDPDDNFLVIVSGEKKLKLFPPECIDMLYVHPLGSQGTTIQSNVDFSLPTEELVKQYPLLNLEAMRECTIRDGEMLYIPYGYWHQVTTTKITISVNFFCGDADTKKFLTKLFTPRLYKCFSYWLLNLIEQNRQHGKQPLKQIDKYSDAQLEDCFNQFFITRYHAPLTSEQYQILVKLMRDYCRKRDEEEGISNENALPAERPPRLKIRGLKWRIQGMIHK